MKKRKPNSTWHISIDDGWCEYRYAAKLSPYQCIHDVALKILKALRCSKKTPGEYRGTGFGKGEK